jgi:hypothetical protein
MITTLCRDCVFATFVGNTQFDCKLNRLKTLQQNGAELTLKEENGRRFYSINRLCNTCRNSEWVKNKPAYKLEEIVRKEIQLQCDVILFIGEIKNLEISLKSISYSTLLPSSVIVILDKEDIKPVSIIKILETMPYTWQLIQDLDNKTWADKIQEAVEKGVGNWYTLLDCGEKLPQNLLQNIDEDINGKLERYVMAYHTDYQVYCKAAHYALNGFYKNLNEDNSSIYLYDKIKDMASKNNSNNMIKNLCTTTSQS